MPTKEVTDALDKNREERAKALADARGRRKTTKTKPEAPK